MKYLKLLPILTLSFFASCETEQLEDAIMDENGELVENPINSSISLETSIEEVDDVMDDIAIYSSKSFGIESNNGFSRESNDDRKGRSGFFRECADISVTEEGNKVTTILTFTGACEDENGNAITGVVTRTETTQEGSSENTLTVEALTINGYVINGTKSFVWTTSNANGNPEKSGSVFMTVETDEGTITKEGTRTVEITEGADTDTWVDNVKTISGSHSYTTAAGAVFGVEITTPLVKPAACKFIVSGVKTYSYPEGSATLDYGDGSCDGFATLTMEDGTTQEVVLGKKRRDRKNDDDEHSYEEELTAERLATLLASCKLEIDEATGAVAEVLEGRQEDLYLEFNQEGVVRLTQNGDTLDQGSWDIAVDGYVYLHLEMEEFTILNDAWKVGRKKDGYLKLFRSAEEYLKVEFYCDGEEEGTDGHDDNGEDSDDDEGTEDGTEEEGTSDDLNNLITRLTDCPLQIREFVNGDSDYTSDYFEHELTLDMEGEVSLSVNNDTYTAGFWDIEETPNGKFLTLEFEQLPEFNLTFLVQINESGQILLSNGTTEIILQITC